MTGSRMPIAELRRALRAQLPPDTFEPQPIRGVLAWFEIALLVGGSIAIAITHPPWWIGLPAAIVLGQMITSISLAAHEAMHGSVFRSPRANRALGTAGFLPMLVTPSLWHAWHVQAHHGATNQGPRDPDAMMEVGAYRRSWRARMRARMSPGHRHWLAFASLFFMFTLQSQVFLWSHCNDPEIRDRIALHRTRERVLATLWIAAWLAGAIALGRDALWVFVIPLLVANFTLMAYITTQHWIRPLVDADDPRESTVSVHAARWFDDWHFQFSYHQEHHLFPRMSHKFGRRVRAKLRELEPGAIAVMPWGKALRAAYATPALYRDAHTLVHEDGSDEVELTALAGRLGLPT
ncbi:MAG TPA: fatty acid desaturase [Kofleriaceae bacterium]